MTREEREKEAWEELGHVLPASEPQLTPFQMAHLVKLRDALNHCIRELGVEDPLEKDIGIRLSKSWQAGYNECEADNDIRRDS